MDDTKDLTKGERTRLDIISAAYNLFLEQGYHGTSMRQISQCASIALGGIYNHFESKEAIFAVVLDYYHPYHRILPLLNDIQAEDIEEFVSEAASKLLLSLQENPGFLNLVFAELVEFDGKHLPPIFQAALPQLQALVSRFYHSGLELRQIPPFILIRTFLGMLFSYVITDKLIGQIMPNEQSGVAVLEQMLDIFLHGIFVHEGY